MELMLYAVRFHDRPERLPVRRQQLQAHVKWLDEHRDVVLVGGSLRNELDEEPVGGLWLVQAPDKAAVEGLLRTDPFWVHGLRQSYEILHWCKAFPERQVSV